MTISSRVVTERSCINRIRLEFKGCRLLLLSNRSRVLIESDWNLKSYQPPLQLDAAGINRIRLEFKAHGPCCIVIRYRRINRIRLEFKDG